MVETIFVGEKKNLNELNLLSISNLI